MTLWLPVITTSQGPVPEQAPVQPRNSAPEAGDQFDVVFISFDPRDKPDTALAKKNAH